MHPFQKMAWCNLLVILVTVTVFVLLYAGNRDLGESMTAFVCLLLLAFSAWQVVAGRRRGLWDEYHRNINFRAINVGMNIFWFYFVICSALIMMYFERSVPTGIFALFFWFGFILLITVYSVAVLMLYGPYVGEQTVPFADRRGISGSLRRIGLVMLTVIWPVGLLFLFLMIVARDQEGSGWFMLAVDAIFLILYILAYWSLGFFAGDDVDLYLVRRARRQSLISGASATVAVLFGVGLVALIPAKKPPVDWMALYFPFYVLFIALGTLPLTLLIGGPLKILIEIKKTESKSEKNPTRQL